MLLTLEPGRWECKNTRAYRDDDGLLVLDHTPGTMLDLEVFEQIGDLWAEACPEEKGYALVLINKCRTTAEGRAHIADVDTTRRHVAAIALVVAWKFGAMMANFFVRFNSPPVPAMVFSDEAEARAWLLEIKTRRGPEPVGAP